MPNIENLTVRVVASGDVLRFRGRDAWALHCLIVAGDAGCTPICHPGPRWSGYVFKLRRAGLDIETITEKHAAPYAGTHARYVLRTTVQVVYVAAREVAA
jgi:hypothetical protein